MAYHHSSIPMTADALPEFYDVEHLGLDVDEDLSDCFDFPLDESAETAESDDASVIDSIVAGTKSATAAAAAEPGSADLLDRMFLEEMTLGMFDARPQEFGSRAFDAAKVEEVDVKIKLERFDDDIPSKTLHPDDLPEAHSSPAIAQSSPALSDKASVASDQPTPSLPKCQERARRRSSLSDLDMITKRTRGPSARRTTRKKRRMSMGPPRTDAILTGQNHMQILAAARADGPLQYHEALQKLFESMKRTELSRRQVVMQRMLLSQSSPQMMQRGHQQQQHPSQAHPQSIQHQVQYYHQQRQQQQQQQRAQYQRQYSHPNNQPITAAVQHQMLQQHRALKRSSTVAAFFSGSRSTLTTELEQSRMRLRAMFSTPPIIRRQPF